MVGGYSMGNNSQCKNSLMVSDIVIPKIFERQKTHIRLIKQSDLCRY